MTVNNRKAIEKDIKEYMGAVPDFYGSFPDAVIGPVWALQKDFEEGESALDLKVKQLIGLALASHIKCKYCIYFHTKAAEAMGASKEELQEACAMGGVTAMLSNTISGSMTDFDKFQKQVDKALSYIVSHMPAPSAAGTRPSIQ